MNTVSLALSDYSFRRTLEKKSSERTLILEKFDILFSMIFISEFLLKIIAMGFVLEKNTYLRNGWNVLDFTVVVSRYLKKIFYIFIH